MVLRYFFDFLRPIFDAFISTDFTVRPSLSATCLVLAVGNTFRSDLSSSFDHRPLTSFFLAIENSFRPNHVYSLQSSSWHSNDYYGSNQEFFVSSPERCHHAFHHDPDIMDVLELRLSSPSDEAENCDGLEG